MKGFFRKDSKVVDPNEKKEEKEKSDVRHSRKSSSSERFSRRLSAVMTTSSVTFDTPQQDRDKTRQRRNSTIISGLSGREDNNKKCIIL